MIRIEASGSSHSCRRLRGPACPVPGRGQATDAAARAASWEAHLKLEAESPFKDLAWRAVGPAFCGGRIQSIAVHPARPWVLYTRRGFGRRLEVGEQRPDVDPDLR